MVSRPLPVYPIGALFTVSPALRSIGLPKHIPTYNSIPYFVITLRRFEILPEMGEEAYLDLHSRAIVARFHSHLPELRLNCPITKKLGGFDALNGLA